MSQLWESLWHRGEHVRLDRGCTCLKGREAEVERHEVQRCEVPGFPVPRGCSRERSLVSILPGKSVLHLVTGQSHLPVETT